MNILKNTFKFLNSYFMSGDALYCSLIGFFIGFFYGLINILIIFKGNNLSETFTHYDKFVVVFLYSMKDAIFGGILGMLTPITCTVVFVMIIFEMVC